MPVTIFKLVLHVSVTRVIEPLYLSLPTGRITRPSTPKHEIPFANSYSRRTWIFGYLFSNGS